MATVALLAGREPATRYSLHRGYVDAVWAIGATPVVLVPPPSASGVDAYVAAALACDAICLTGGGDVDPARYGEASGEPALMDLDGRRDEAEISCVAMAVSEGRAVLGICRGIQVIAVALGGTLHLDLPSAGLSGHWEEERQHEPVHTVAVARGSQCQTALGGIEVVNSIHHQAVRSEGPDLTVTAWAPDGVIEAIEAPGVLGVQWHPERLFGSDERHLSPFWWLLAASGTERS